MNLLVIMIYVFSLVFRSAKSGKFECSVMSLSVLLDYRPEDNKEHMFEVSLFAESFNEMLMRDFGFTIYKKVHRAAKQKEAEQKRKEEKERQEAAAAAAAAAAAQVRNFVYNITL